MFFVFSLYDDEINLPTYLCRDTIVLFEDWSKGNWIAPLVSFQVLNFWLWTNFTQYFDASDASIDVFEDISFV